MHDLMSKHTGRPVEQIERDFDRDYYMSAEEAKAYGIIDKVVSQDVLPSIHAKETVELTKS